MTGDFWVSVSLYGVYAAIALLLLTGTAGWWKLLALAWGRRLAGAPDARRPFARLTGLRLSTSQVAVTVAFAVLSASLLARAAAAARPPWGSQYEFALAFAWGALGLGLVLDRHARSQALQVALVTAALLLLLYASTLSPVLQPTIPALQSPLLLALHVGAAIVAYGANAVACCAALLFLMQLRFVGRRGRAAGARLGSRELLGVAHRAVAIGFPALTATLLFGSLWASITWGYYWSWDPKEKAALGTWLIYAIYLHRRTRPAARESTNALILVIGFAVTLLTYAGNLFFSSLHSYAGL
ncbi:MAG: cytochrome c biogenesis protein CcsA [Chloroflexota bacterium]|nr:cytochrome c biogenesis protein CcsA [Chloroflexota bacterium]